MTHPDFSDAASTNPSEGYDLEVNDVATLLGVTRTRVSQLTSSGQLSFERRRVGARSRLFYKKSEVLLHQKGYYGRHSAAGHLIQEGNSSTAPRNEIRPGAVSDGFKPQVVITQHNPETPLSKLFEETASQQTRILENALSLLKRIESMQNLSQSKRNWVSATAGAEEDARNEVVQDLLRRVETLSHQMQAQNNVMSQIVDESFSIKAELRKLHIQQEKSFASLSRQLVRQACSDAGHPPNTAQNIDIESSGMDTLAHKDSTHPRKKSSSRRLISGSRRKIHCR